MNIKSIKKEKNKYHVFVMFSAREPEPRYHFSPILPIFNDRDSLQVEVWRKIDSKSNLPIARDRGVTDSI